MALSYLLGLITGIVFVVLDPHKGDCFMRFHAAQSILFCAAAIVYSIAWSIILGNRCPITTRDLPRPVFILAVRDVPGVSPAGVSDSHHWRDCGKSRSASLAKRSNSCTRSKLCSNEEIIPR